MRRVFSDSSALHIRYNRFVYFGGCTGVCWRSGSFASRVVPFAAGGLCGTSGVGGLFSRSVTFLFALLMLANYSNGASVRGNCSTFGSNGCSGTTGRFRDTTRRGPATCRVDCGRNITRSLTKSHSRTVTSFHSILGFSPNSGCAARCLTIRLLGNGSETRFIRTRRLLDNLLRCRLTTNSHTHVLSALSGTSLLVGQGSLTLKRLVLTERVSSGCTPTIFGLTGLYNSSFGSCLCTSRLVRVCFALSGGSNAGFGMTGGCFRIIAHGGGTVRPRCASDGTSSLVRGKHARLEGNGCTVTVGEFSRTVGTSPRDCRTCCRGNGTLATSGEADSTVVTCNGTCRGGPRGVRTIVSRMGLLRNSTSCRNAVSIVVGRLLSGASVPCIVTCVHLMCSCTDLKELCRTGLFKRVTCDIYRGLPNRETTGVSGFVGFCSADLEDESAGLMC